ncbi:MAG: SGNH/GDSL hydrolase family protein [Verrucomicrobiales bacterium]|nr:SGNH/GDSL hydrolase family protein [Verrucomicrobiales bacterium]
MKALHPRSVTALLALFLVFNATAQQKAAPKAPAAPPSALELQAGDTLVFLGDSITHQCLYTQYVENFFYTRYPDRRLRFHNAGVSGDRAVNALARFEQDVASFKPAVVTVLLGMNDGEYADFRPETFETYSKGMTEILDRVTALGARPVVMSPTMFDHHQLSIQMRDPDYRFRTRTFDAHYNALLAYYGGWLRETAGSRGLAFVDQWGPMNEQVFMKRRSEPDFTLVPDAIHPAPAGQFLMAFELINQVTPERRSVSSINIVPGPKGLRAGVGISDLVVSEAKDRITFTHLAPSLPWVIPAEAYASEQKWDAEPAAPLGYQMTVAGHRLSNERLRVAGLAPGTYELKIDGQSVGKYSHLVLGSKIELQSNEATPQHQQALDVALLNRERNDKALRPLRDVWAGIKGLRSKLAENPNAFAQQSEPMMTKVAELVALSKDYEDRIHLAAQPRARKYELVRLP